MQPAGFEDLNAMKYPTGRFWFLVVAGACCWGAWAGQNVASAADKPAASKVPSQPPMKDLVHRMDKLEAELKDLRSRPQGQPEGKRSGPIVAVVESAYLGFTFSYYGPPNGSRFLAARLVVVNPTSEPIVVKAKDIVLRVEGSELRMKEAVNSLRNQTFQAGGQTVELSKIRPSADLVVPPGVSAGKWLVFAGIPSGIQIPAMVLHVPVPGTPLDINVNEAARRVMGLKVERIGPRGCLALLTVSGELNTVNIGSLTGVLESLVAQKVVRAVIRFSESAPPLEGTVLTWLQQGAEAAGRTESTNQQMPVFPAALRELHLAAVPNRAALNLDGSSGPQPRIHSTDADAVRAALKTAIEVLPRDELLAEIEAGNALTRAAALADGGGRLAVEDLPLVLKYADDNDPRMQLAALAALRHFGERPAIEKLLAYARRNAEPTASLAIESLAASRYAAAHQALLDVLKNEHPASRRLIVRVLAKYPRPIWSDTIYSFVSDSEPEVAVEALRALVQTGHPRLFAVLKDALARGTGPVRDEAFQLLASRSDRQSEELALEYTLQTMKNGPPTPAMYGLLNRTKDARAVHLLLAELDRSTGNRSQIINTLAQIGDQAVADALAAKYPEFSDRDKTAALNAMQLLKSPQFRKLAGEALLSNDSSLVSAAVVGLQNDGSPRAVQLLVGALESSSNPTVWSFITNALGNFGTSESKAALRKAVDSDNDAKRNMAITALRSLHQRSPGYPYCMQARQSAQSERWDEAISRFTSAIELDPELAEAYSGRGHALLQKKQVGEARKDFTKAIELESFSSEAVTGLGICLVQEGHVTEGIKVVENSRTRMNEDFIYTYNAACVYGRALERLLKEPKSPERDRHADGFRAKAIADLRRSVKLGFPDLDWMKKDSDLDSLHDMPEFKKIVSQDGSAEENRSSPDKSGDDKNGSGKGKSGRAKDGGDAVQGGAATTDSIKADLLFENARP
jgi:HEAT repeat protein